MLAAKALLPGQIDFAKVLDEKGYLYEIPGDGMYFDTSKLSDYGKLAKLDIAGLEGGARVSVEGKRNITDFAVWKFSPDYSKGGKKRDMEWDSPWGIGFPGWHLECSVIARETLGDQIDIHTGGIDHIPVHHTNEIAQTEAVTDKPFSAFWVHNNHLKADGQKMSKSLGNIYTLQDILDKGYDLDAFRVFALGKHYRTEGNFTWDNLEAAHNRLNHWREAMATRWQNLVLPKADTDINAAEFDSSFLAALSNDLNTSEALRIIDDVADKALAGAVCGACLDNIAELVQDYLGITIAVPDISEDQKQRIADREQARVDKNWAKSDEIRDILAGQEIGLRDTPRGAVWYRL